MRQARLRTARPMPQVCEHLLQLAQSPHSARRQHCSSLQRSLSLSTPGHSPPQPSARSHTRRRSRAPPSQLAEHLQFSPTSPTHQQLLFLRTHSTPAIRSKLAVGNRAPGRRAPPLSARTDHKPPSDNQPSEAPPHTSALESALPRRSPLDISIATIIECTTAMKRLSLLQRPGRPGTRLCHRRRTALWL